ncbi:penicillin-binding protein 2 [soil metagenome]
MKLFQPDTRQRRTLGAVFAVTFVVFTLLTVFFQAQVLSGAQYALRSEENRLRPIPIPAPRGTILDRHGEIVATSVTGYSVSLLPGSKETVQGTLEDLAPFLGLAQSQIETLMEKRNARPNDLLKLTDRATYPQIASIEERRTAFPNLLIVERPVRHYPAGPALAHIIGYVSEISKEELAQPRYQELGYRQGRIIGKAGLEKQYEALLSGVDGARFVEVDAMGRVVDPRASVGTQPPVPGKTLQLTLDLGLQRYLEQIFPDTMKGAIAAVIPTTGEVLALYSNPSYDPNDFVGGISSSLWRALNQDTLKPLLDRGIYARYPPGSTWKLATAIAGLQGGVITPQSKMPIPCTGGMYYAGRYARCWEKSGHGYTDLAGAVKHSCDVYFYQVGIRLGLKKLAEAGTRMGFSSKSGIDLPGEAPGRFPTGLDSYEKWFGHRPTPSEVMSLAIGQGPNDQSVVHMAEFYSALAGDGTTRPPHLAAEEPQTSQPGLDLEVTPDQLQALWKGLAAVTEPGGTAYLSALARWRLYGKTGTSENPHGEDHGWFAGFAAAPGKAPEVVVVAIVEHGAHGSDVAPLVSKAANYYLNKKYGFAFDAEPTLIERWESGRCPWEKNCIPADQQQPVRRVALR